MTFSLPLQSSDSAQRLELEDGWELLIDPTGRLPLEKARSTSGWRGARVGLSWNVQFGDLRDYMGAAWYRIRFDLPTFQDTRHILLKFGAVDYFCEVFLNNILIGTHEGGYTPFSFEVTSAAHSGLNEMMIRVVDPPMDEAQNRELFPEMMYNEIPHGKQNWYVQNSGIWQGVRLELCPSIYIERLDVIPEVTGHFKVEARLAGIGLNAEGGSIAENVQLRISVYDKNGRRAFQALEPLTTASHCMQVDGFIETPALWGPDSPDLYGLVVQLEGAVQYHRRTRFGFRSFEANDGKLYFNGEPFFVRAALDQDFYPETIHTPTSMEFVRDMMVKAKNLGINMLRCHLKVAHPVYLDVADEVGMLIWTELPSWSDSWFPSDHFSTMAAIRAEKMFWEILIRDWNHPCIVLQTIMNESWGINLNDASQREWLKSTFDRIKGLLKPLGRLVVDNSPCEGNFHLKTDIEDFHQYYSMPDHVEQWNKWLSELASRPDWTFSPYGDAVRTGREPLMVSEFGNWGLPKLPDQLPWWFDLSFGERGVTKPSGVLNRFVEFGLDKIFGSFNELAEETQLHQFISLKYEIESIRSYELLQGYVITGVTDVHWEVNGLLDMWRNEKVYARQLSFIQQPDLIACKLPSNCFFAGDEISIPTFLSHFSARDFVQAKVRWSTTSGQSGSFIISETIRTGQVHDVGMISLVLPDGDRPITEQLQIEVRLRSGERIAENSYDLFVLPQIETFRGPIRVHCISDKLTRALAEGGSDISPRSGGATAMICGRYDDEVAAHLRAGGCALLIAESPDALPQEWPLRLCLRAGTELDGRWFSNFNWIRAAQEPFASVAFSRILGFEAARVAPSHIIRGIGPEDFGDVLAGITYGWLNNNSALAAQVNVGPGKLIITTFRFDRFGVDPYATHLLHSLLRYVSSPQCSPRMQLPVNQSKAPESVASRP